MSDSTAKYAGRAIAKRARVLLERLLEVQESGEAEAIHQARVACRRARAAIKVFESELPDNARRWRKWISRAGFGFSEVRDMDIMIDLAESSLEEAPAEARLGIERIILRLKQGREKISRTAVVDASKLAGAKTLAQMEALDPGEKIQPDDDLVEFAKRVVARRFNRFFKNAKDFDAATMSAEELHKVRIAAKQLRYSMEVFRKLLPVDRPIEACRSLQDALGEINDATALQSYLDGFIETERERTIEYFGDEEAFDGLEPGISFLTAWLDRRLVALRGQAAELWETLAPVWQGVEFQ